VSDLREKWGKGCICNKELSTYKRGEHGLYLILHETNERAYNDCGFLGDQRWQLITDHIKATHSV